MAEYWFLLPVGVAVATVGMSSGIASSNFWIPIYLLWLRLEPRLAFWVSLLTMLFGFGSGIYRNLRAGTVDRARIRRYLVLCVPAAVVGSLLSTRAPEAWLLLAFAVFALLYGLVLLLSVRLFPRSPNAPGPGVSPSIGLVAGFLHGLIATGSGVLLTPALLRDRRIRRPADAVGSAVVLVFACSLVAVLFRLDAALLSTLDRQAGDLFRIMLFAAPGVVIGGQLGPRIAARLPRRALRRYIGVLLVGVSLLIGWRALGS